MTVKHDIALWAGLTALFTNLAAIAVVDAAGSDTKTKAVGVIVSSIVVGATVYCKQRWDDAKGKGEVVDMEAKGD